MATMSSKRSIGATTVEQSGEWFKGERRVAGLVAATVLGVALLAGGLSGHGRQPAPPIGGYPSATPQHVYVALGDRDDARFAASLLATTPRHVVIAAGDRDDQRFATGAPPVAPHVYIVMGDRDDLRFGR